jgi:hypothetical protein
MTLNFSAVMLNVLNFLSEVSFTLDKVLIYQSEFHKFP